jgi:hypothetical protein
LWAARECSLAAQAYLLALEVAVEVVVEVVGA